MLPHPTRMLSGIIPQNIPEIVMCLFVEELRDCVSDLFIYFIQLIPFQGEQNMVREHWNRISRAQIGHIGSSVYLFTAFFPCAVCHPIHHFVGSMRDSLPASFLTPV